MLQADHDKTIIMFTGPESPQNFFQEEIELKQRDKEPYRIGRHHLCDIVLPHRTVSAYHADLFITHNNKKVRIKDRRSANGLYDIYGERIPGNSWYPDQLKEPIEFQISIFTLTIREKGGRLFLKYCENVDQYRLQTNQASFHIKNKAILDNISIVIHPGEFVGLYGPSGSGKTTLLKLLSGYIQPTHGNVLIGGLPLKGHFDLLKERVGYVPQDDIIFREFTVYDSLLYSAKLRLPKETSLKDLEQAVDETLKQLDIEGIKNQRVSSLSGGQRKRVSIGVELLTRPRILLMDEPDAGLDPHVQDQLMDEFRKQADSGASVVMTTHTLDNFHRFDYVAIISVGQFVFYGAPSDALAFFQSQEKERYRARDIFRELDSKNGDDQYSRLSLAESHAERYRRSICFKQLVADRSDIKGGSEENLPPTMLEIISYKLRKIFHAMWDIEYKKFGVLVDRHINLRLSNWRTALLYLMIPFIVLSVLAMQQTVSDEEIASIAEAQTHYVQSIERQKSKQNNTESESKGHTAAASEIKKQNIAEQEGGGFLNESGTNEQIIPVPELDIDANRMLLKPKIPHIFPLTLVLTAIFCGIFISSSEISQEWGIYKRERLVCTNVLPYLLSKLPLLFGITFIQMSILFSLTVIIKNIEGVPFFMGIVTLTLVAWCSVCLGLLLSTIDKSGKTAIILSIAFIIPQIIWSGAIAPNFYENMHGIPKAISTLLVSRWGFEGLAKVFNDNSIIHWGNKLVEYQIGFPPREEIFNNPLCYVHLAMIIIGFVLFLLSWVSLKLQDYLNIN